MRYMRPKDVLFIKEKVWLCELGSHAIKVVGIKSSKISNTVYYYYLWIKLWESDRR